ncbi:hypothetical protein [Streptomyces caniscabiei]|uniref:Secreted protein n=1 Tax=Streptomyces caniscabiei TaxID=2746961 RepID=A0A927L0W7_9ACTN|nr:hypothetical protein [Streptomyces caniscabiei]MBD9701913.1 hypothetical protein [Streptomyces caniscabiei]MBD9722988.1 hypothetical protein [Streptomyces caniscabiei]MDX3508392.1 hypothetical protein [Streptomyces caniscabiei]MDX3719561.1 hypothetical protein [Streptomyces caniscabiei]MDX3728741.1 hypothetical protein [Streptomyces caniscabiei]
MARHSAPQNSTARRALLAAATAGVALGAGAGTAAAADDTAPVVDVMRTRPTSLGKIDPQAGLQALTGTVGYVTGPVAGLKPNPLAGTGVDPLDNGVGTQLADFQPLTSTALTGPVAQAPSVGSIPLLGPVVGGLKG